MRKLFVSIFLVALGAGSWWLISRTARFSIKKWDAKFGSVLRQTLDRAGITNQDIISSVHELKKDKDGEWVIHRMELKLSGNSIRETLQRELENSGGQVIKTSLERGAELFQVKRGSRIYQEIIFSN